MMLKDGTSSDKSYGYLDMRYTYFLPQNNKITAVTIYYDSIIGGFRFHLSDGSTWDIGMISHGGTETVEIADNEVIVGFKAKSDPDLPAFYVEWQFITA